MPDSTIKSQQKTGDSTELAWNKFTISEALLILEQARISGDPESLGEALLQLAYLHFRQGRYNQTQTFAEEVLNHVAAGSVWRCDALRLLGNCAAELGDPEKAENYYHQAIDLARQTDYRYALFKCLHSLATNIYWPQGQFELCLAAGKEALAQAETLGLRDELWFPLSDIGWAYWSTGQRLLALDVARQMQSVVTPGSLGDGFTCCLVASQIEVNEEYLSQVLPLYEHTRSIAEATGDPGLNIEVRVGLCRAYRQSNDFSTALLWAEDAVRSSKRLNYLQFQALTLIERGRTLIEMGNLSNAETDFLAATDLAVRLHAKFDQTRATLYLATCLSKDNSPQAGDVCQTAIHLIRENGYGFLVAQERTLLLPWIAKMIKADDPNISEASSVLAGYLMRMPPPQLMVRTLGQYTVRVGSYAVSKEDLRQRRAGELFALLLTSPGYTLSQEQVSELMCPEKDPSAAADFYHHAISTLRRILEPDLPDRSFPSRYLEISEERVRLLIPPGSTIDFLEFENSIGKRDWTKSILLYTGDFLPLYRYTEWTIPIEQRLSDQFEQALLVLAEEQLIAGNPIGCLQLAQRALSHNPWQEKAVMLGMLAAQQLDDRATALKLYHRLEKKLDKDLGIAPEKKLQQLFAEIKKQSK